MKAVLRSDTKIEEVSQTIGSGLRGKLNKVVLAYSGGLDTSVIVPWLRYILCLDLLSIARLPLQFCNN